MGCACVPVSFSTCVIFNVFSPAFVHVSALLPGRQRAPLHTVHGQRGLLARAETCSFCSADGHPWFWLHHMGRRATSSGDGSANVAAVQ